MAAKGGAREGAGRPLGTLNRRSTEMLAELMASGQSPIEYLVGLYRDPNAEAKDRSWAANVVAPYVHPRMGPAAPRVTIDLPKADTAEGVKAALARIIEATAAGEIAPAEAQSLVTIIEAQRKAIETAEVGPRLDAIEEALSRNQSRGRS